MVQLATKLQVNDTPKTPTAATKGGKKGNCTAATV